ncbi:PAS/PAC sensor signal transduction histidine kinase [Thioalkalivibrio nitratireducens DSM 14787]|uniref:histidine kinase n=1 Tax=Thioalkalivibrio nitratireducens (strain DSM 14787 / UNIQEM 213 / ALEN2) TaxID=1255043 RepID=L0DWI6_THIND|nr:PAS/PAC sensor signal transduction histidine kinase [Thioalkalivibrio nitratireducens DSM 14787]
MILIDSLSSQSLSVNTTDAVAQLFEELYDPALLIDPEQGAIVGANHAACLFLGYSADELAALTPADIHPHEIPRLDAFLSAVKHKGRWVADDLACRVKSGGLIPAQVRATLVRIAGRPFVLAIVHDRRDAELAELGRSIRKVTHDLRNTMVASRLMSDRLRRHEDPLVRQSAEIIARSVDRALGMCERTLEAGSASEPKPRRERFTLGDLVSELHAAAGPEEVAAVRLEAPDVETMELDADYDQIFRILMNLIRNAIGAGSTRILLTGNSGNDWTTIVVRDNGPGLPEAMLPCLFAEKSPVAGKTGGLGLAIAWELARNNGGDLTLVDSGPQGTAFRLVLPAPGAGPGELAAGAGA